MGEGRLLQIHMTEGTRLVWKFQEASLVSLEEEVRDGLVEKTTGVKLPEGEMLFQDYPPATTRVTTAQKHQKKLALRGEAWWDSGGLDSSVGSDIY